VTKKAARLFGYWLGLRKWAALTPTAPVAVRSARPTPGGTSYSRLAALSAIPAAAGGVVAAAPATVAKGSKAVLQTLAPGRSLASPVAPGMFQAARETALTGGRSLAKQLGRFGTQIVGARIKTPGSMAAKSLTSVPNDLLGMRTYVRSAADVEKLLGNLRRAGVNVGNVAGKLRPGYHGLNIKGTYQGTPMEMQALPGKVSDIAQRMQHSLGYKVQTEAPYATRLDKLIGNRVVPRVLQRSSWSPRATAAMRRAGHLPQRAGGAARQVATAGRSVVRATKPVGRGLSSARQVLGSVGQKARELGRQAGQVGRYAAAAPAAAATGVTMAFAAPTAGTALAAAPLATAGLVAGAGAAGYGVGRGISYLTGQDRPESWSAGKLAPVWGRQGAVGPEAFGSASGQRPAMMDQIQAARRKAGQPALSLRELAARVTPGSRARR